MSTSGRKPEPSSGDRITVSGGTFHAPVLGKGKQYIIYGSAPTALASLPAVPAGFTGRDQDLNDLLESLGPSPDEACPAAAAVVSVAGLPGVGKTSLALAAGHAGHARGWFDGTLFVDLHGYDESPVEPFQALEGLLRALGVAQVHVPPTLEERQGLYRSQLGALAAAGRAVLVVADNASSAEQVHPLLPGDGRHRLLVTSRNTLHTLRGRLLDLRVLSPEAAVHLLDAALRIAHPADFRIARDPTGARELALLCGYMPLALQIAAARLIADPDQQMADLAVELEQDRTRLGRLDDAIRASFNLSYRHLSDPLAETFRLLALNPSSDITTEAAAVLTDQHPEAIGTLLAELAQAHLLERRLAQGRWRMHDLIRAYASEQADTYSRAHPRAARAYERAQRRLLDHYTTTAEAASTHLAPDPEVVRSPHFATRDEAVEWLDAELPNLVAASVASSTSEKQQRIVLSLPRVLGSYLNKYGYIDEWLTISRAASQAAHDLGDHDAEAVALEAFATALGRFRREREANDALEKALEIARHRNNREIEAQVLTNLGIIATAFDKPERAITCHKQALQLYTALEDTHGEAAAWHNLAQAFMHTGQSDQAFNALDRAASIYRQRGNEGGATAVLLSKGITLGQVGRLDEAITCFRAAAAAWHERGSLEGEARALSNLSGALLNAGRHKEAIPVSRSAVEAHRRMVQNSPVPYASYAGALTTFAVALYRSRKDLGQAAAAIDEALAVYDQIPGGFTQHREVARETATKILRKLGAGKKNVSIRRQLEARLNPAGSTPVGRKDRWLSRRRHLTPISPAMSVRLLVAVNILGKLSLCAWVAVVGCGFFHARQAQTSVWLLIAYCVIGLIATGLVRPRVSTYEPYNRETSPTTRVVGCCTFKPLLTFILIASLVAPEQFGPLNAAGEQLARTIGLA
ncbi:tetratricopeptide repeat protein [Streptomyces flavidovirens]|uniref:Tetratricopeptide repeat protein n=1 Tax=Streptomyces flavidovirens TaxID=67298 RepID=A0ABW6RAW9_9ACTN